MLRQSRPSHTKGMAYSGVVQIPEGEREGMGERVSEWVGEWVSE